MDYKKLVALSNFCHENGNPLILKYFIIQETNFFGELYSICIEKYLVTDDSFILLESEQAECKGMSKSETVELIKLFSVKEVYTVSLLEMVEDALCEG